MIRVVPAETTQRIREVFETTCIELFRSLNCDVVRVEQCTDSLHGAPLSYIDAGSDDIEVVIVLRAPLQVLSITYPKFESDHILSVSEEKLEDWISELANQLVGRFKNQLLSLGCPLQIGLPELIYDTTGVKLPVENHEAYHCFFELDKEGIECSLFTRVFNENMSLTPQQQDSGGVADGELELF